MKRFILLYAIFGLGCSQHMKVLVLDQNREPVSDVVIERHKHVSRVQSLFNPVGAFYHPHRLVETRATKEEGIVEFESASEKDQFHLIAEKSDENLWFSLEGKILNDSRNYVLKRNPQVSGEAHIEIQSTMLRSTIPATE
jgi:hypothetical protein